MIKIQLKFYSTLFILILSSVSCEALFYQTKDEDVIRNKLGIASSVKVVYADGWVCRSPSGNRQCEGSKKTALLQFNNQQFSEFAQKIRSNPNWKSLPIPAKIFEFQNPPIEFDSTLKFDASTVGSYYCVINVYNSKTKPIGENVINCESAPTKFDDYLIAVLNEKDKTLQVIKQNYY
jgi:hypothetical protein